MNIDVEGITAQSDKPLTRSDVEELLHKVGSSSKLNLSGRNMAGIDLAKLKLAGTDLSRADLSGAKLSGANLSKADLIGVYLIGANLSRADLSRADLIGAWLSKADLSRAKLSKTNLSAADLSETNLNDADFSGANLSGARLIEADLSRADLSGADLSRADLSRADLSGARLSGANLSKADLSETNLDGANLDGADLSGADLSGATMSEIERGQLRKRGILGLDDPYAETTSPASTLRIRIIEEPLTPYNLSTIISALTELATKFWLIAKGRFADLIEYAQTHDVRFVEEVGLVITRITYNSPLDITLGSPNFDPKGIVDALVTTIDGITQRKANLERAEFENLAKTQAAKLAEQQLALQKQGREYALEIARKTVDLLHADDATKGMIMQALLPDILQLQNGEGIVLALPEEKIREATKLGWEE